MRDAIVYGIEILVGAACCGWAVSVARRASKLVAGLLGVAGAAAIGHGVWALVG